MLFQLKLTYIDLSTIFVQESTVRKNTLDVGNIDSCRLFRAGAGLRRAIYSLICTAFMDTPPKTNMDTQNDGLEKVTPFEYGNFWYLC